MLKIPKSSLFISWTLAIVFIIALVIDSCKTAKSSGSVVLIENPKDLSPFGLRDHFINSDSINLFKAAFAEQNKIIQDKFPSFLIPESEAFNKRSIISLLQAPGCVGIRIYHGVKSGQTNELRVILVGVDANGKDILIAKSSILAAKILPPPDGGLENGQCPNCR